MTDHHQHEMRRWSSASLQPQCMGPGKNQEGQCDFEAVPDSTFCSRHGGQLQQKKKKQFHGYMLDRWMQRSSDFNDTGHVKSLRAEIGILKMLLEQTLAKCDTTDELFLQYNIITDLVTKIQGIVRDATKLEASLGLVMDQEQAARFVDQILTIIEQYIDAPTLAKISESIATLMDDFAKTGADN